jgi:hypothetical protein
VSAQCALYYSLARCALLLKARSANQEILNLQVADVLQTTGPYQREFPLADNLAEQAFMYVGGLASVREKAAKLK